MKQKFLNKYTLVQFIVHRLSLTNAKTLIHVEMESTWIDRHGEKTVSVDPLSSRGINKFHLDGDFHLESYIEAIKVYQCLSKLSLRFASYESSRPYEYQWHENNEATKQPMVPDTSTCVADHNDKLSKDSVIYLLLCKGKLWGIRTNLLR